MFVLLPIFLCHILKSNKTSTDWNDITSFNMFVNDGDFTARKTSGGCCLWSAGLTLQSCLMAMRDIIKNKKYILFKNIIF